MVTVVVESISIVVGAGPVEAEGDGAPARDAAFVEARAGIVAR